MSTKERKTKPMVLANERECKMVGLNPRRVEQLAQEFSRLGRAAARLGITVFGGSGHGSLRFDDGKGPRLIVADISGGNFDGGDGACMIDNDGILRGE